MGVYGWKATIGIIVPPRTNETVIEEAVRLAPDGVSWCWSVLGLPEFEKSEFDKALDLADIAARELANRDVDVIVACGIPLLTSQGPGYHAVLEKRLADAIGNRKPVTTDIHCVLGALKALRVRDLILTSIYQPFIQEKLIEYLAHYGVRTVTSEGLNYALADCMTRPTMQTSYELAMSAVSKAPTADALFISCPQWPVIGNVERVERETGKTAVAHLAAVLWGCLGQLGMSLPIPGYGRLLSEWPEWMEPTATLEKSGAFASSMRL